MINPRAGKFPYSLLLLVSISSIALSVLSVINALPNNDGITYMKTAEQFLSSGISSATQIYDWPFYPVLIALCSKFTGLSILNSAYGLDGFFQLLVVLSFLNLFNKFNPTKTQFLFAVVVIMIFPQFNDHRSYILRDFGYWAFNLIAISNLMTLVTIETNQKFHSMICVFWYYVCFILAFLFRSESIVLMLSLPLSILFLKLDKKTKSQKLLHIYSPLLIAASIFVLFTLFVSFSGFYKYALDSIYSTVIHTIHSNLKLDVINYFLLNYVDKINLFSSVFFTATPISTLASLCFLWFGLCAVFIVQYLMLFNIINFGFLLVFVRNNKNIFKNKNINNAKLIFFAILISLFIPTLFLYTTFIITARYYLLSAFLLLLFVPFGIDYLWKIINLNHKKYKNIYALTLSTFLLIVALSGLTYVKSSKEYIKQASIWYKKNNLPVDAVVATNNPQLAYLIGLENSPDRELKISKNNFKYLLIKVNRKDTAKIAEINQLVQKNQIAILKTFANKRNDQVFVIKNNAN